MEDNEEEARKAVVILQRLGAYLPTLTRILESARCATDVNRAGKIEYLIGLIQNRNNTNYANVVKIENGVKNLVARFYEGRERVDIPDASNIKVEDLQSPESPPSISQTHTVHTGAPKNIPMERSDAKKYIYDRDGGSGSGRSATRNQRNDRAYDDLYYRRRDHDDYDHSPSYSRDRKDRGNSRDYERKVYSPRDHSWDRCGRSSGRDRYERNSAGNSQSRDSPVRDRQTRSPSRERFGSNAVRDHRGRSPTRDYDKYHRNNHKYHDRMKREPEDRYSDIQNNRYRKSVIDRVLDYERPIKKEPVNDKYEKSESVPAVSIKNEPKFESSPQPSTSTNIFARLGSKIPTRPFEDCRVEILPTPRFSLAEIDEIIKENDNRAGKPEGLDHLQRAQQNLKAVDDVLRDLEEKDDKKIVNSIIKELVVQKALQPVKNFEQNRSAANSPRQPVGTFEQDLSAHVSNMDIHNRSATVVSPQTERVANKYNPRPRSREDLPQHVNKLVYDNAPPFASNSNHGNVPPSATCSIGSANDPRMRNRDPRTSYPEPPTVNIFANMNAQFGNRDWRGGQREASPPSAGIFSQMNSQLPPNIPPSIRGVFGGFPHANEPPRYNPNPFSNPYVNPTAGPAFNNLPANNFNRDGCIPNNIDSRRFSMSSPSASPFEADSTHHRRFTNDNFERQCFENAKRDRRFQPQTEPQSYREHRLAREREARERELAQQQAKKDAELRTNVAEDEPCTSSNPQNDVDTPATTTESNVDKAFRNHNWKELPSASVTKSFKIPKKKKPDEPVAADNRNKTLKNAEKAVENDGMHKNAVRVREADTASVEDVPNAASDRINNNSIESNQPSRDPRRRPRAHTESSVPSEVKSTDEKFDCDLFLKKILKKCQDPEFFELIVPTLGDEMANSIKQLLGKKKFGDDSDVSSSTGVVDAAEEPIADDFVIDDDDGDDLAGNDEVTDSSSPIRRNEVVSTAKAKRKPQKKKSSELSRLHEDLRSMFMTNNGNLNLNGRRLCTLARSGDTEHASAESTKDRGKKLNAPARTESAASESDENAVRRATLDRSETATPNATSAKRIMRRRNTSAAPPPRLSSEDERETTPVKAPAPKKISQRRNTLASRTEHSPPPSGGTAAKKIGRRRLTRCEFIDDPSSDSDRPGRIRMKIISHEEPQAKSPQKKRRKQQVIESDLDEEVDVENDYGLCDNGADGGMEIDADHIEEPLKLIAKKNKRTKRPSFDETADMNSKKAKKSADVQPTRARLSRECKVILNKLDAASMAAAIARPQAAQDALPSSQAAADTEHDDDDLLEAVATESDEPKSKRTKIKKNTNKFMYNGNPEFDKQCPLCSYKGTMIMSHFLNHHRDSEYFMARPSPEMADALRTNKTIVTRLGKNRFSALCYFCKESRQLSKQGWVFHLARHTGEYIRRCGGCKHNYFENKHKCDNPQPMIVKTFNFDSSLSGYLCKLCNFIQMRREAVHEHLRQQHAIGTALESQYDVVQVLYNFHGDDTDDVDEVKVEEEAKGSATKTPIDSVAFKASQPDEGDLFDQDTMNLMKQNISFTEEEKPKRTNSQSMIDRLSKRFNIADPPKSDEHVEIVYRGPEDEPLDDKELYSGPSSSASASNTSNPTLSIDDGMVDSGLAKTEDDVMDFENDDDNWEDCSNSSEMEEEAPTNSKNISIQRTLQKLLNRTKKGKSGTITSTLANEKTKKMKKEDTMPVSAAASGADNAVKNAKNSNSLPPSIASVSGNVTMPIDAPIGQQDNDGERVAIVIENIVAVKQFNKFEFQCDISRCNFRAPEASSLYDHIHELHEDVQWSGYCTACLEYIAHEPQSLEIELAHLTKVHCRKQSEEPQAVFSKPAIKVRRLSGDLLSKPFGEAPAPAANIITMPVITTIHGAAEASAFPLPLRIEADDTKENLLIGNTIIKPWIQQSVRMSKRREDVDKLLRRISLCAQFKCMGRMCIFTTDDAAKMLQHLGNHERRAEDRVDVDGASDTDSWLECAYCDHICESCSHLVQHVQKHHSGSIYQCHKCFYRTTARFNVVLHCKKYHAGEEPNIIQCNGQPLKLDLEKSDMTLGRQKHLKPVACPIPGCSLTYYVFDHLKDHIESEHASVTSWKCPECPLVVSAQNHFKHLSTHGIACYQCLYCPMSSNNNEMMQTHMSDQHANKMAYCSTRLARQDGGMVDPHNVDTTIMVRLGSNITAQTPVWISDFEPHQVNFMDPSLEAWTQNAQDPPSRNDLPDSGNATEDGGHSSTTPIHDSCTEESQTPPSKRPRRMCVVNPNRPSTSADGTAKSSPTASPIRNSPAKADAMLTSSPSKVISSLQNEVDAAAKAILKGTGLEGTELYRCAYDDCNATAVDGKIFNVHLLQHSTFKCYHCKRSFEQPLQLKYHMKEHGVHRFFCYYCDMTTPMLKTMQQHFGDVHKKSKTFSHALRADKKDIHTDIFVVYPGGMKENKEFGMKLIKRVQEMRSNKKFYWPHEIDQMPQSNIYPENIYCGQCNYGTKVRPNMQRHLSQCREGLQNKTVPVMDAVNPAPCLDTGKKHFDKMMNLAASSHDSHTSATIDTVCHFIPEDRRFVCGTNGCRHRTATEDLLRTHISTLHGDEQTFTCTHCNKVLCTANVGANVDEIIYHMRLHDAKVFKCPKCNYCDTLRGSVDKHITDEHPRCKDKPVFMTHSRHPNAAASEAAAARDANNTRPTVQRWRCEICKALVASKALMQQHLLDEHRITSKYLCRMCGYNSDIKSSFVSHFAAKHPGQVAVFKTCYELVKVNADIDVTPLWRRDDPNRIKHIRGILVDEEVSKRARSRAVRKTSSSSSLDSTRTYGIDMEASGSESNTSSTAVGEDGKKKAAKQGNKKQK